MPSSQFIPCVNSNGCHRFQITGKLDREEKQISNLKSALKKKMKSVEYHTTENTENFCNRK